MDFSYLFFSRAVFHAIHGTTDIRILRNKNLCHRSRGTIGIVKYDGVGMCTESVKHGIHTEIMKKNLLLNDYSKDRDTT